MSFYSALNAEYRFLPLAALLIVRALAMRGKLMNGSLQRGSRIAASPRLSIAACLSVSSNAASSVLRAPRAQRASSLGTSPAHWQTRHVCSASVVEAPASTASAVPEVGLMHPLWLHAAAWAAILPRPLPSHTYACMAASERIHTS